MSISINDLEILFSSASVSISTSVQYENIIPKLCTEVIGKEVRVIGELHDVEKNFIIFKGVTKPSYSLLNQYYNSSIFSIRFEYISSEIRGINSFNRGDEVDVLADIVNATCIRRDSTINLTMRIKNIIKLTTYEERENKFNEYVEIESSKEGIKGLVIELLISLFTGFIIAAIIGIWFPVIAIIVYVGLVIIMSKSGYDDKKREKKKKA
ncbi:MAG: hypothetical protein IPI90_11190 [Saprospiraceae bacterium]|nr:hypothetical protein [Candidatus Vicinibacter affinis]